MTLPPATFRDTPGGTDVLETRAGARTLTFPEGPTRLNDTSLPVWTEEFVRIDFRSLEERRYFYFRGRSVPDWARTQSNFLHEVSDNAIGHLDATPGR